MRDLIVGDIVTVETPFQTMPGIVKTVNVKMNCYTVQYIGMKAGGQFERGELHTPIEELCELVRRI